MNCRMTLSWYEIARVIADSAGRCFCLEHLTVYLHQRQPRMGGDGEGHGQEILFVSSEIP